MINSTLPLLLAHSFYTESILMAAVVLELFIFFTMIQTIFWWSPYVFGEFSGTRALQLVHKRQLESLPRILPAFQDHLVPDNEHSILFLFSVMALFAAIQLFQHQRREYQNVMKVGSYL